MIHFQPEITGASEASGSLMFLPGNMPVGYNDLVELTFAGDSQKRVGRVVEMGDQATVVEVYHGTSGLSLPTVRTKFLRHPFELGVSEDYLGRSFNGFGKPIDGGPLPLARERRDINGSAINPVSRLYPDEVIVTGLSVIDGMNTMVRGQKLPIFSLPGMPVDKLAAQIISNAHIDGSESFAIVFAAIGIGNDTALMYKDLFSTGALGSKVAMFLNLADAPAVERLITPRIALTLAEYLAFDCNMHVLVVMTDMTNYCEALREIAISKREIPSRKGYPGYLYSDLSSIFERAGQIKGRDGSITQLPILTMPNDDITHPLPDITGYITEGQLVLDRDLFQRGIYPPINPLPSLSRLMHDGIGSGKTRDDHQNLSSQLYAVYARARKVQQLASIIGEEDLSSVDRLYLKAAAMFENEFIAQAKESSRQLIETLDLGWKILSHLPVNELTRVSRDEIDKYYQVLSDGGDGKSGGEDEAE